MPRPKQHRTIFLFIVLAVYIIIQFVWWGVLLLRRDAEVARLALEIQAMGGEATDPIDTTRNVRMVLGEGIVFLTLLLVVLFLTFRAIRRDLRMARSQRNFLMAVTHELRTPIAGIKLQLQTLGRGVLLEEQRELLRMQAIAEADRLALLTDKVLLATRVDDGDLGLRSKELEAMELLRTIVDRSSPQIAPAHTVILKGPGSMMVNTDSEALRSITDNLIENAAKYAPVGTTITVELLQGRDGWRLLVSDEGPGVIAGDEQRVFEKFHRSGNEETRNAKGTGLGLYIVDRLVRGMGGAVHVKKGVPKGAIFVASFPNK